MEHTYTVTSMKEIDESSILRKDGIVLVFARRFLLRGEAAKERVGLLHNFSSAGSMELTREPGHV
jgi:hypothetical protein